MNPPLSISEQERLIAGHEALVKAIAKVSKAKRDYDLIKSNSYWNNLRRAITEMESIGKTEHQYIQQKQKEIF